MRNQGTGLFPVEVRCNLDKAKVAGLIERKAHALGASSTVVSSVVVANDDDSDYGVCITRSKGFMGGQTHTPGSAGKTLPFIQPDMSVISDLVFPRFLFEELLSSFHASDDHILFDYVVSHELAHSLDFAARRVLHPKPLANFGGTIEECSSYWGPLLLSEFAASFLAGTTMTSDQYDLIVSNSIGLVEYNVAAAGKSMPQLSWLILVEQAKIAGSSFGCHDLKKPEYGSWAGVTPGILEQFKAYVAELKVLKVSYSKWDEGTEINQLTQRCKSLFAAMQAS